MQVAIIGGGPAGIGCAIQLSRSGIPVTMFEKYVLGGLSANARRIENLPGMKSISGSEFCSLLKKQVEASSINVINDEIINIEKASSHRFILQGKKEKYHSEKIVIASGTVPYIPDIKGISSIGSRYISYEWKKIPGNNPGEIGIIGAGDAAFDQALSLCEAGWNVTLLIRNNISALPILTEAVKAEKIKMISGYEPLKIHEVNGRVKLRGRGASHLYFDSVLIACGRIPSSLYRNKYLKMPGIIFAGDVINGGFRQAAIAFGDGLRVAMGLLERFD